MKKPTIPCPCCGTLLSLLGVDERRCAFCGVPLREHGERLEIAGAPAIETRGEIDRRAQVTAEVANG